jgi:hypothetical protein
MDTGVRDDDLMNASLDFALCFGFDVGFCEV